VKKDLSDYCQTVCKAQCCKRGKLPLTSEETELFSSKRIDENNFYDLTGGCQHLRGVSCGMYEKRPVACRTYPFHAIGPILIATTSCPAVDEGFLDEDIEKRNARKL
jgi:Fe-S-cluster containining protein